MLRIAARARPLPVAHIARRTLASSVLLDKTFENATVSDLKTLLKARGLPAKGNKATLITRIQQHDRQAALAALAPDAVHTTIRHAATVPVPGIPASADSPSFAGRYTLAIKLPDLSTPLPEAPIQIPYGPDFWNSKAAKHTQPIEQAAPKLLVVAGTASNPGPAHSVHESLTAIQHTVEATATTTSSFFTSAPKAGGKSGSIWADIAEDIGLPTAASLAEAEKAFFTEPAPASEPPVKRALNPEERSGLYVLLGIIAGSWLVGGIVNGKAKTPKQSLKEAKDKSAEALK